MNGTLGEPAQAQAHPLPYLFLTPLGFSRGELPYFLGDKQLSICQHKGEVCRLPTGYTNGFPLMVFNLSVHLPAQIPAGRWTVVLIATGGTHGRASN